MIRYSVRQIFQDNVAGFLSSVSLPLYQHKALNSLLTCRTAQQGGHAQYCENGHLNGVWYNSCKHRACPQCRNMAKEEWTRNTQRLLLDCPHHHVVFTVPSELNVLWRYNRELLADLLFQSVRETLKTFSQDPRYLAATPGILSTLHTWGRDLCLHPHIHVLISHGGLNNEGDWVEPRKRHLFPQQPVMMVFRGKLLWALKSALKHGKLSLPPDHRESQVRNVFNKLGRKAWVVHFGERYDHAKGVATYLGRYVKGGPFKNSQITAVDEDGVRFRYKSHKTQRMESMSLSPKSFMARLLQHIPIPSKPTVRYGGLYVSSCRERLNRARESLGQQAIGEREQLAWKTFLANKGCEPVCQQCGSSLIHRDEVGRLLIALGS